MTIFDYAAGILLLLSGLFGFVRGATRELTTVLALIAATIVAVVGARVTGPFAAKFIHTAWLANTAAVLLSFILVYSLVRLAGGALTRGVQQTSLSGLDRLLGFGVGLVRALLVLGAFALLLDAATPVERMPHWITDAKLYPLASAAGGVLRTVAPAGLAMTRGVAPELAGDSLSGPANALSKSLSHRHRAPDHLEEESR